MSLSERRRPLMTSSSLAPDVGGSPALIECELRVHGLREGGWPRPALTASLPWPHFEPASSSFGWRVSWSLLSGSLCFLNWF